MGGIIHAGTNTVMNWTFHATCRSLGLKSGVMHLTCPSIILVYLRTVEGCSDFKTEV